MEGLGFSQQACLRGTGISSISLADADSRMTLQQEVAFYSNTLELTGDPAIGLKLGELFLPQRYGLFGYTLLSAATCRQAFTLTEKFGLLTFSFFSFSHGVSGTRAWFRMSNPPPLEQALIDLYFDRDMSAAMVDFGEILGRPFLPSAAQIPHDGHGRKDVYADYFGCELQFNNTDGLFVFDSRLLDDPLPQSDPESLRHLQQQCQVLIAKLSKQGRFVDHVRMLILSRPGYFPDIDYVAEKLGISNRTLRRRLTAEGSNYRVLLDEIRYGLAREYLDSTSLPLEDISNLLGYSEPGNFTHAFRRWSGAAPSVWRRNRQSSDVAR
tara:strand:- start:163778 stop:164752 length:975 start_codon:yes stop_codon:yes gene_type:complete